jgi:hypothetical protein
MYLARVDLHDSEYNWLQVFNIWQNVDLNKIAIAIAYKQFF